MSIYTKAGDKGKTSLRGNKRVLKNSRVIEALGTIDELNAVLGSLEISHKEEERKKIEKIQTELIKISSIICGYKIEFPSEKWLEEEIDKMQKKLPKLHGFVLPSGQVHVARTVCRRAERRVVAIGDSGHGQNDAIRYLNRLGDYLFVLALVFG